MLMAHSQGSASIIKGARPFLRSRSIAGIVFLAGQNFDTEALLYCHGVQLLVVHGKVCTVPI
jgi:hypothetical protein